MSLKKITFNIHTIQEYLKYIYKIMAYTYTFIHIYKALNSPLDVYKCDQQSHWQY